MQNAYVITGLVVADFRADPVNALSATRIRAVAAGQAGSIGHAAAIRGRRRLIANGNLLPEKWQQKSPSSRA
jgi:hypothetical protein